jgi:SAM-dependent methyltransferase
MRRAISSLIERSACLSTLNYLKGQFLYRTRLRSHGSGATHAQYSTDASVAYIQGVVADYLQYAGVDESFVVGKRFLEVGPGDNLGVALALLAKGADHVTCFDRFQPFADQSRNLAVYRGLYESFAEQEQARAAEFMTFSSDGGVVFCPKRLHCQYGVAIETWKPAAKFDVVLSRAVLEHVFDLDRAWNAMTRALRPGGQMWHKVDLRHHGYFGQFHPLYFLSIENRLWTLVSSPDPTLNRKRLSDYRRLAEDTFEDYELFVTHILDHPELIPHRRAIREAVEYQSADLRSVESIRNRLVGPLRRLPAAELLVTGIFLIVRSRSDRLPHNGCRSGLSSNVCGKNSGFPPEMAETPA